jgi:hypothetical protein
MTEPVDVPLPPYKARQWYTHYSWLDAMVRWAAALLRSATGDPTGSSIMRRYPDGTVAVNTLYIGEGDGSGNNHAARRDYVDAIGTTAPTGDTVFRRNPAGGTEFSYLEVGNNPTPGSATRKDYVDAAVATSHRSQTGSVVGNYTITVADERRVVWVDAVAAARTIVVPADATADLPIGAWIDVVKATGANDVIISGADGVQITSEGEFAIRTAEGHARLWKLGANRWHLFGTGVVGTPSAVPHSVVRRDSNGYIISVGFQTSTGQIGIGAAAPTDPAHATRKDYVDALGTDAATPSSIVRRSAGGFVFFSKVGISDAPTAADQATRKDYVDGQIASTGASFGSGAGTLVRRDANGDIGVRSVALAVTTSPGHAARKDYVDAIGTVLSTPSTIVRRTSGGGFAVGHIDIDTQPSQVWHGTRKDYVDTADAALTSISATPPRVGKLAVVAGVGYLAVGTASAADWKQITN